MSRIRIGMIGCGYWGPNLLRNLRAQKALRVKTVADSDPKRLAFVKETHPGHEAHDEPDKADNDTGPQIRL